MQHATNLLTAASSASASIENAVTTYKELSSSGSFKDIYLGDGNDGFMRYILKAQDLVTLAEVLYTHVEATYSTMIDVDKMIAVQIANDYYLNNPEVSQETKDYIRQHPQEALEEIKSAYGLQTSRKVG
ncbi:hypothetical protein ACTGZQ_11015 [Streptococcus suis]|nr:hypothetical protein [Streptococcus suis]